MEKPLSTSVARISFMGRELSVATDAESFDPVSEAIRKGDMPVEHQLFSLFPEQNGTFIDIGANIGAFCISFASRGWKGFSFEASSRNATLLKESVQLNNFDVHVSEIAIYSKTGKIYFVQNGPFGFIPNDVFKGMKYDKIDCTSLDDWMQSEKNIEKVDLMKIDIEGSEVYALRGMKQFLSKFEYPPIFMEVNAFALSLQKETSLSLLSLANNIGYNAYEIIDDKLHPVAADRLPLTPYTDYFLIHGEVPPRWHDKVAPERVLSDEDVISSIIQQLSDPSKWEHHTPYLCYALKDFPKYYEHPHVKSILSDLATGKYKDSLPSEHIEEFLKKTLSWYMKRM